MTRKPEKNKISTEKVSKNLLFAMTRIRMVEEEIAKRYPEQEIRCPVHLSIGQEAAAVGVCSALQVTDWAFSGHRNHAHYLAKGGNLKAMIAEIYGKVTGCSGGRGGSMHLTDQHCGFIGATPIVGSTVPIAVGAALTAHREGKGRIVVVFLGDGAMEAGVIHESLNFAALKELPILFVCENNLYSVYSPLSVRQPQHRSISEIAQGHGIKTIQADGNDVEEVYANSIAAVSELRRRALPIFMELSTYRWLEHCGPGYDNTIGYRTEQEFEQWKSRDPLRIAQERQNVFLTSAEINSIENEINLAFKAATSDQLMDPANACLNVYSPAIPTGPAPEQSDRELSYADALREAHEICLDKYQNSYLMGLGVPDPKGIFGTTLGLEERFGADRVFDIPLSENAMTGVAIGSAITGLRPILTHQRLDFALVSIDQLVNQAAKWYYMFNGVMNVPIVIRMIVGRGWGQGPQHSQSLHAWFSHVPGLKVVMPSSPYDAKGLLIAAIEDNNPTVVIEHRWLHSVKGRVPLGYYKCSLDKAKVIKKGNILTLIGISFMTIECIKASRALSKIGIDIELIDLISIRPIDFQTIKKSVLKTKRLIVVDQADKSCSVASEIIASIAEEQDLILHAPPKRISLPPYPAPTSHFGCSGYYPSSLDIAKTVLHILKLKTTILDNLMENTSNKDQPDASLFGPF